MSFEDKTPVEVEKGLLVRMYALMATGSFMPSMFSDVRDVMIELDSKFGEINEADATDRDPVDGPDSEDSVSV